MNCKNHQDQRATFHCLSCGHYFCSNCIKEMNLSSFNVYICKDCGGKCEKINAKQKVAAKAPARKTTTSTLIGKGRNVKNSLILIFVGLILVLLAVNNIQSGEATTTFGRKRGISVRRVRKVTSQDEPLNFWFVVGGELIVGIFALGKGLMGLRKPKG